MESPAAGTSIPCRKPLQPWNSPATPASQKRKPDQIARPTHGVGSKESHMIPIEQLDASLAEELGAARRRRERLRKEREKTEKILGERDRVLQMGMRELGKRGEEQRGVEMELFRLVGIGDLELFWKSSRVRSLREREEERKNTENSSKCQGKECGEKVDDLEEPSSSSREKGLTLQEKREPNTRALLAI